MEKHTLGIRPPPRLKHEHRDFESRLIEIEERSRTNSEQAIEILGDLGKSILRHAVEEEARIMLVIIQKQKNSPNNLLKSCKTINRL